MTRFKPLGFAAGLTLGLAGVVWHIEVLVWAGIALLAGVVALRLAKRDDRSAPES